MNNYKIHAFDHCELYVGNAKQAAHYYQYALGFTPCLLYTSDAADEG